MSRPDAQYVTDSPELVPRVKLECLGHRVNLTVALIASGMEMDKSPVLKRMAIVPWLNANLDSMVAIAQTDATTTAQQIGLESLSVK